MHVRSRFRRWSRRILLFFAVTLAVMVTGLAVEARLDPGKPQAIPPAEIPDLRNAATPPPPASGAGQAPLAGPVQMVQGTHAAGGVALGFPHSTVGAVSAAAEFSSAILSTLDPGRAAAVMRLVADSGWPGAPQLAAEGIAGARQSLGIPATGPVPGGASFAFTPVEYQVRGVSSDAVTVLLLADLTSVTPAVGTVTQVSVFPVAMHWARGDWKVLRNPAGDYEGLAAEPDTPQAAALGWQDLIPAGGQ